MTVSTLNYLLIVFTCTTGISSKTVYQCNDYKKQFSNNTKLDHIVCSKAKSGCSIILTLKSNEILDHLNKIRKNLISHLKIANMKKLVWDHELATFARYYARQCTHSVNGKEGYHKTLKRGDATIYFYVFNVTSTWDNFFSAMNIASKELIEKTAPVIGPMEYIGCAGSNQNSKTFFVCAFLESNSTTTKMGAPCSACEDGWGCDSDKFFCIPTGPALPNITNPTGDSDSDEELSDQDKLAIYLVIFGGILIFAGGCIFLMQNISKHNDDEWYENQRHAASAPVSTAASVLHHKTEHASGEVEKSKPQTSATNNTTADTTAGDTPASPKDASL